MSNNTTTTVTARLHEESRAIVATAAATPHEVLTRRLGAQQSGIDILGVQEIRSFEQPTHVAGAPVVVLGGANLRGVILPIVDLHCRFGLQPTYEAATVTVVFNVTGRTAAAVVDAVSDVVHLGAADIKPASDIGGAVDAAHIMGIANLGDAERQRTLILLDIEQVMSGFEIGSAARPLQ